MNEPADLGSVVSEAGEVSLTGLARALAAGLGRALAAGPGLAAQDRQN